MTTPASPLTDDDIQTMIADAEDATHGPWVADHESYPPRSEYAPIGIGFNREVWQVRTQWTHPQLQGPLSIVQMSYSGYWEGPVEQIHIEESDARHIANLNPAVAIPLLRELLDRRAENARLAIDNARLCEDLDALQEEYEVSIEAWDLEDEVSGQDAEG